MGIEGKPGRGEDAESFFRRLNAAEERNDPMLNDPLMKEAMEIMKRRVSNIPPDPEKPTPKRGRPKSTRKPPRT